jgi:LysR family transcriptional regulator, nod-box dependent transcriptional activator
MKLRNFDLNLLLVMEAIWATRSVSLAAKRLNLAQSTVSAALSRLRRDMNDQLFAWTGHEMIPTPLGNHLIQEVIEILDGARALLSHTRGERQEAERRVVIATADYVAAIVGAGLIMRSQRDGRNLAFDFVSIKPQAIDRNSLPDVDLFIFPLNALRVTGLRQETLWNDEYVCIAAENNSKIYEGMEPAAFLKLPHVGYSALPRVVFNHESLLWDDGAAQANYRLTMANYLVFPRIVAFSDAVAILPRRLAVVISKQLPVKCVEIPLPVPKLVLSQLWHTNRSSDPALLWLREALIDIGRTM